MKTALSEKAIRKQKFILMIHFTVYLLLTLFTILYSVIEREIFVVPFIIGFGLFTILFSQDISDCDNKLLILNQDKYQKIKRRLDKKNG